MAAPKGMVVPMEESKGKSIESRYKYLRIQGLELAENTMYAKGVFSMCWQLVQNVSMEEEDAELFKAIDAWFAEVLPFPPQCKNNEKVVYTNTPGEIVYEDQYQVAVKVPGFLTIEKLQESWSPKD